MSHKRPDRDGWWEWDEGSMTTILLLTNDGATVAYDDEWEKAVGRSPNSEHFESTGITDNYWEGTETTQEMMPGTWRYLGNLVPAYFKKKR